MDPKVLASFTRVLAQIKSPLLCDQYDSLYREYLIVIGNVAGLLAKNNVHTDSIDCSVSLDVVDHNRALLCSEQSGSRWSPTTRTLGDDTLGILPCVGHSLSSLVAPDSLANGQVGSIGNSDASPNSGVANFDRTHASCVSGLVPGKNSLSNTKKRQRRRNRNGNSAGRINRDSIGGSDAVAVDCRVDTPQIQKSLCVSPCHSTVADSCCLRGNFVDSSGRGTEAHATKGSDTFTGHLVRHSLPSPSNSGFWSRSSRGMSSSASSDDCDEKVAAVRSLWKRRNAENLLAISKCESQLSSDDETVRRLAKHADSISLLTRENLALRKQVREQKSEKMQLLTSVISARRGISV